MFLHNSKYQSLRKISVVTQNISRYVDRITFFEIFCFVVLVFYEIYLSNICDCAVLCSDVVIFEMVKLLSAVNGPESHWCIPNPKDFAGKRYLPGMIVHMFPAVL